jgi:hypothetical protein
MSQYDDRHQALKTQLSEVQGGLANLPDTRREGIQDELGRLEEALGFAALVIDKTDPDLVPDAAHNELSGALTQISDQVVAAEGDPASYTDTFLNALTRLPAAKGEITAQDLKATVADFQRSAKQRLTALSKQIETARGEAQAVASEIEARREEFGEVVETKKQEFGEMIDGRVEALNTQLEELQGAVETEKQRVENLATEQGEAFRQAQEERAAEFKEKGQAYEERVSVIEKDAKERIDTLVNEIEEMKDRSAKLVGAIGITGTAGRYKNEADEQKKVADRLRLTTVGSTLIAIAVAIWATHETDGGALAAKLVISLALGGVAGYLARQSARHRGREERARDLQNDLTAFPVMSEALPEDQKIEQTVEMINRSFLGARPLPDHHDEPGPMPARQLLPRRTSPPDEQ